MASTSNEESKIFEHHGVTTMVHEMKVDHYHLLEMKQKSTVDPKASEDIYAQADHIHSY